MSMFSGIGKAFKSVFKGVKKVFKTVVSGVKSFIRSDAGKIILIAAAVWLGGATMGYWNSGFSSIDGALASTQGAGAASASDALSAPAAQEAMAGGAGSVATENAASTATGGISGAPAYTSQFTAAPPGTMAAIGGGAPAAVAPTDWAPDAVSMTQPSDGSGFMHTAGKAVTGAAKWMAANPVPTLVGGQMLASAFSPNQLDANEQQNQFKIDEEKRRQADIDAANARIAQVGGINTWGYNGQPGQAQPAGILGRRLTA